MDLNNKKLNWKIEKLKELMKYWVLSEVNLFKVIFIIKGGVKRYLYYIIFKYFSRLNKEREILRGF